MRGSPGSSVCCLHSLRSSACNFSRDRSTVMYQTALGLLPNLVRLRSGPDREHHVAKLFVLS